MTSDEQKFAIADAMQWMLEEGYLEEYWEGDRRMVRITPEGYAYMSALEDEEDDE